MRDLNQYLKDNLIIEKVDIQEILMKYSDASSPKLSRKNVRKSAISRINVMNIDGVSTSDILKIKRIPKSNKVG